MRRARSKRGFTLAEMAVTVGIVGLLATLAVAGIVRHRQNAEDVRMQAELVSIYKAMEAYRQIYRQYPTKYAGELSEFISIPSFDRRYRINSGSGGQRR